MVYIIKNMSILLKKYLVIHFFINNTDEFYKFYKDKMNSLNFEPNITHKKLVELEQQGKLKAIITQNIDGLHQKAGSKNVYELHRKCFKKLLHEM